MVSMGAQSPQPAPKNRNKMKQFFVARARHHLYDSRKASGRVPKQDVIATARAIILVAFAGGAIWFLLWKLAVHLWAGH
jgi:hypothetical protein